MKKDFSNILNCRLCGNNDLKLLISLNKSPLANQFKIENNKKYPLEIFHCNKCLHNQLGVSINPDTLFKEYFYQSSFSDSYNEHNLKLAKKLIKKLKLKNNSKIIDVGSNDGVLINAFKLCGLDIIGVEPSTNLSKLANKKGLKTLNYFFGRKNLSKIKKKISSVDLIVANNVYAHIDNMSDFTQSISNILNKNGFFVFEVSYFKKVITKTLFDTIYHEHLDYHLIKPIAKYLKKFGLYVFDAESIKTHGGSLRIFCSKQQYKVSRRLKYLVKYENLFQNRFKSELLNFNNKISFLKRSLISKLEFFKKNNYNIICYGASAKASIFINQFELSSYFEFCLEDSKVKFGGKIPGTNISIIDSSKYLFPKKTVVVISAWNFYEEIINKINTKGIIIIVPLPKLKIINFD